MSLPMHTAVDFGLLTHKGKDDAYLVFLCVTPFLSVDLCVMFFAI